MLKEVLFDVWCPRCEHFTKEELESPCYECLDEPANEDSHKPVRFKEKEE